MNLIKAIGWNVVLVHLEIKILYLYSNMFEYIDIGANIIPLVLEGHDILIEDITDIKKILLVSFILYLIWAIFNKHSINTVILIIIYILTVLVISYGIYTDIIKNKIDVIRIIKIVLYIAYLTYLSFVLNNGNKSITQPTIFLISNLILAGFTFIAIL